MDRDRLVVVMSNQAMRPGPTSAGGALVVAAWSSPVTRVEARIIAKIAFRIAALLMATGVSVSSGSLEVSPEQYGAATGGVVYCNEHHSAAYRSPRLRVVDDHSRLSLGAGRRWDPPGNVRPEALGRGRSEPGESGE